MKRNFYLIAALLTLFIGSVSAQHNAGTKGKVLMVASNKSISKQTGWPIGVWYAELTHPFWAFSEAGYTVEIATPEGGDLYFDAFSDPEDESKYAAFDYISLGFKKDPAKMALTKNTKRLADINPDDYKAIFLCGGQGPMYTFYQNPTVEKFFVDFYRSGKPTAAICHATCVLLHAKLPNGSYLVEGKKWTGFSSEEEQYADNYVGKPIQPFRIEELARNMPKSGYRDAKPFAPFAIKDGNLITGQQQNSGMAAAELVLKALEEDQKRYPTYVLVHGAWADESAWGAVRNQLAVKANVEVVNLPAHGIDLTNPAKVNMESYINTVKAAILKYPGKLRLVGHSMAGMIISQLASQMPEKIEQLIYVSAFLPKNGESLNGIVDGFLKGAKVDIFEFSQNYSLIGIKKEAIPTVVCDDCPSFMKEVLVKYHRPDPLAPFNEKAVILPALASVPSYYISTKNDRAVPYALQQQMIQANGKLKKVFEMETSHLPFVVQPQEFVSILQSIK